MADKDESEVERLYRENEALRGEVGALKQQRAVENGPPYGTKVCYQRQGEGFCRPGAVASDGFTEQLKSPTGIVASHALIEYGEPPWTVGSGVPDHMKAHSFQTDRSYDPSGKPETWHLPDECPRRGGPGCPYAKKPVWPAPDRLNSVEAP